MPWRRGLLWRGEGYLTLTMSNILSGRKDETTQKQFRSINMVLNCEYSVVFVVEDSQSRILGEDMGMKGNSELAKYHDEGFWLYTVGSGKINSFQRVIISFVL